MVCARCKSTDVESYVDKKERVCNGGFLIEWVKRYTCRWCGKRWED